MITMTKGKRTALKKISRSIIPALAFLTLISASGAMGEDNFEIEVSFGSPPEGHPQLELEKLSPDVSEMLRKIADHPTLYMEIGNTLAEGDPYLYEYLFDRLSLSTILLRELELARYNIYELSPDKYSWVDPKGVFARFELIYKEPGKRIYYGSGFYDGRLMPRVDGKVVLVFLYHPVENHNPPVMLNEVYGYIEVDGFFFSTITKILQPFLPRLVRSKMNKLFTSTKTLTEWIARDPLEVYDRLEDTGRVHEDYLSEFKRFFMNGDEREFRSTVTFPK